MSISSVLNYRLYYRTDTIGLSDDRAKELIQISTGIQTVPVLLASYAAGWLSDRGG